MGKAFFAGLPTEIDVRKLRAAFPKVSEGDEITHGQLEEALGFPRSKNRYRTVTNAWRKQLFNEGLDLGAVVGVGFRCLTAPERISGSIKGFQAGTRKQLRSVRRAVVVRTEDPILVHKQDLLRRAGAAIVKEANTLMREIEPPAAARQLPKPRGAE